MSERAEDMAWTVERSGWPAGPWDDEPDRVEWRYRGLPCLIVRTEQGALCGYVGVPSGHPADNIEGDAFLVHGGITYQAKCQPSGPICHVPAPGEPDDVVWLGFDCGHAWDLVPGRLARGLDVARDGAAYRDESFVRRECQQLADQILALASSERKGS